MNYDEEKKRYVSYCGSYCRTCDWFTGKIRRTFQQALDMVETYGFFKQFMGKVDIDNLKVGLKVLADSSIDSGCKADLSERIAKGEKQEDDRCKIRWCCHQKGYDLCSECADLACDLLTSNPGVIKFKCIENLNGIRSHGFSNWFDSQWKEYLKS